jgi:glycosyltransferase involved in cell wall biosynthesis
MSGRAGTSTESEPDLERPPAISVILPAHNEVMLIGSTVTNLVTGLQRRRRSFEIVVVENGSTDGTLRLARLLAAQLPHVRVLSLATSDYGAALATGYRGALGAFTVSFDIDYYDLSFLDAALPLLDSGEADVVLASKRAPGAHDRRPLTRRFLTAGFTAALRRFLDLEVSDAHGIKAMRTSVVAGLIEQTVLRGSLFDVELVLRASRAGLAVRELPVSVRELRPPRTPVLRRTIESAVGLVRLRLVIGAADAPARTKPWRRRRPRLPQKVSRADSGAPRNHPNLKRLRGSWRSGGHQRGPHRAE